MPKKSPVLVTAHSISQRITGSFRHRGVSFAQLAASIDDNEASAGRPGGYNRSSRRRGNHVRHIVIAQPARLSCELGRHGCRQPLSSGGARSHPGRRNPPLPRQCSRGAARRPAPAHHGDTVAGPGDRRRSIPGHAAGEAAGARALLGHRLRLAKGGGEAERSPAVHDDDRRAGHSLHPRPLAPPERAAGDHHARLAGLGVRAAEGDRAADRSDRPRRPGGGRLRRRHPFDAGLRLLRQADGHGLESRPHRASLGGADEAPRVHPLRRPGRRLGLPRLQRDGAPGAGRIARHPHQLAGDGTARGGRGARRRRACAGGTLREGTRGVRLARHVLQEVPGLRRNDGHAAAGDRLRLDGLSSGACGLDV